MPHIQPAFFWFCSALKLREGFVRRTPGWQQICRWFCGSLAMVLICGSAAAEETRVIRIGVPHNSPPLSFVDSTGAPSGYVKDLLHEMELAGGVKFEITSRSWNGIRKDFLAGRLDALAFESRHGAHVSRFDFSISHTSVHLVAYTRVEEPPITHSGQFVGKILGTLRGTQTDYMATSHQGWGAQVRSFKTWPALLQAVENGECDFALRRRTPELEGAVPSQLEQNFVEDITASFSFAVHQGDNENLALINEALAIVMRQGSYDRIYSQWIGPIEPRSIRLYDLRPYYGPIATGLFLLIALFIWLRRNQNILERHARALHESEEKYRLLVEHTSEGIFVVQDGIFKFVNPTIAQMSERTAGEMLGSSILDFLMPADHAVALGFQQKLLSGELKQNRVEYMIVVPSGRKLCLQINSVRIDWEGRPATLSIATDLTETRLAEQARIEASQHLSKIANGVPGMVYQFRLSPDGTSSLPYTSDGIERIFAVRPSDVQEDASKLFERIHPEDLEALRASIERSARDLTPWVVEFRVKDSDGTVRWIAGTATPQSETDGSVLWHGYIHDNTGQKTHEIELALQEARFRAVFDHVPVGISLSYGSDGTVDLVNAEHARITGVPIAESYNAEVFEHASHPDDYHRQREASQEFLNGEVDKYTVEKRYIHPDGHVQWAELTSTLFPGPDQDSRWVVTTLTDIGERKRSDEKQRESEERFRMLYQNSVVGFYRTTPDGRILMANSALVKMLGYSSVEELCSRNLEEEGFAASKARALFKERLDRRNEIRSQESEWLARDGSIVQVNENCRVTKDATGQVLFYDGTVEDITERKKTEERMAEQLDELRRWQEVMLDREDRVQQLKREVNALAVRLGESAKYRSQENH